MISSSMIHIDMSKISESDRPAVHRQVRRDRAIDLPRSNERRPVTQSIYCSPSFRKTFLLHPGNRAYHKIKVRLLNYRSLMGVSNRVSMTNSHIADQARRTHCPVVHAARGHGSCNMGPLRAIHLRDIVLCDQLVFAWHFPRA